MNLISLIIEAVSGAVGGNIAGAAMKENSLGTIRKLHCWNCRGRPGRDTPSEHTRRRRGWRWLPGFNYDAKQRRRWRRRRSNSHGHHRLLKERYGEKIKTRAANAHFQANHPQTDDVRNAAR